jgi:GTP-binding protein
VIFVLDLREGVTDHDRHLARWLKRKSLVVIPVVNKVEGYYYEVEFEEETFQRKVISLGFGPPLAISAIHGDGSLDLLNAIVEKLPKDKINNYEDPESQEEEEKEEEFTPEEKEHMNFRMLNQFAFHFSFFIFIFIHYLIEFVCKLNQKKNMICL